jgi:hypothetical protein
MGTEFGSTTGWFIARFGPTGVLDTTFNGSGVVTVAVAGDNEAHGLAITPTGRYLVVGDSPNVQGNTEMTDVQFVP